MTVYDTFVFKPISGYWFSGFLLEALKKKTGCFETTFDLGLTFRPVCVDDGAITVDNVVFNVHEVDPGGLDKVTLCEENGLCYVVEVRGRRYYKLKAVAVDKAPTVEIDGIHMHRVVGVDPWVDAELKVKYLGVKRGDVVLDTCMGLGYTAIHSLLKGAKTVYTVEIDENLFWIAARNPWSRSLSNENIVKTKGDVTEVISRFNDNTFSKVIHDPPRFTASTGDLYGFEFYLELYRVLKPCGKLYHYTGEPRSNTKLVKGVGGRLRKTGFVNVRFIGEIEGYIAFKPCSQGDVHLKPSI